MDPLQSKVLSMAALGVSSVLVGIAPHFFANQGRRQWPLCLSTLLCFGAGVLLSTALVHILPELRETVPEEYKRYTEMVFCTGFFLLYMLDEIVHYFYGDSHEAAILHNHGNGNNNGITNGRQHPVTSKQTYGAVERMPLLENHHSCSLFDRPPSYNPAFPRSRSDSDLFCEEAPSQLCHVGHREPCHAAPTSNVGLLAALSVHSLLEGMVVGLEARSDKVLLLLGAIASHKLVVAFCLGMELASNPAYTFWRHFVYILIFSLGTVGGILGGMFVTNISLSIKTILMPSLQALAGGTLLYVTVSEVLPRERARWHKNHETRGAGLIQLFSVMIGFVTMTTLGQLLDV